MLSEFLRSLQGGALPAGLKAELSSRFGPETVRALRRAGILLPGPRASYYPCPGLGDSCPREVIENPGDTRFPYVAVPCGSSHCCDAKPLILSEVETLATSKQALLRFLREAFGIRGQAKLQEPVFPGATSLGRARYGGIDREALFMTQINGDSPVTQLRLRLLQGRATLALVPARSRYSSPLLDDLFSVGPVTILFLEDELSLSADGLITRNAPQASGVSEPRAAYNSAPPYCVLHSHEGSRSIDEDTYRHLIEQAETDADLLLDLTHALKGLRHPAYRRKDGQLHKGSLTPQQAAIYAELMLSAAPRRASELQAAQDINHPHKLIEAARRALDVKLSRYQWRSTQLLRGDTQGSNRYAFQPPDGLRWFLFYPLPEAK